MALLERGSQREAGEGGEPPAAAVRAASSSAGLDRSVCAKECRHDLITPTPRGNHPGQSATLGRSARRRGEAVCIQGGVEMHS